MIKYAIAVIVILSLIGAGVLWITNITIQAERSKTLERAIELTRDSDKRLKVIRKATDADLCRALGGSTIEGECT